MTRVVLGGNLDHGFDGRPKAMPKLALGRLTLPRNDSDKKIPSVREALGRLTMRHNGSDKKIPSVREAVGRLTLRRNDSDKKIYSERETLGHLTSHRNHSDKKLYSAREAIGRLSLRRNGSDEIISSGWKTSRCLSSTSTRVPSTASSRCHSARCPGSAAASTASSRCHSARDLGPVALATTSARCHSARGPGTEGVSTASARCHSARGPGTEVVSTASERCHSARCAGIVGVSSASSGRNSARCPSSAAMQQTRADVLSALPGSLRLTSRDSGSLSGSGHSSYLDAPAAEVSPTCSLLGWKSPPPSTTRLYRVERRKKVCHQVRTDSTPEPLAEASKPAESVAPEAKAFDPPLQASLAEESPVLYGFTRVKTGKVADARNRRTWFQKPAVSLRRFGSGFDAESPLVCLGGLFSEEVFRHYDADHNGRLSAAELGSLLRDHGMCLDYFGASRVLELIAGTGSKSIGFEEFPRCAMRLVEKRRGSGGEAAEVLQCVFRSYDANKSGMLEVPEYTQLLSHLGHKPRTKQEWADQGILVASCRGDPVPGPLNFQEFVVLARKINAGSS